jgi:hypothetical protein
LRSMSMWASVRGLRYGDRRQQRRLDRIDDHVDRMPSSPRWRAVPPCRCSR